MRRALARLGRGVALGLVVVAVAWPAALGAQQGQQGQQGRRNEQDRERLEQRIRAQMGRMMRERLGLDEAEATRLASVVQDFDERRRALFQQEQATRRSVEAFLAGDANDQSQALALIERVAELRLEEAQLFREEQEALLDVLTPTQLLELQDLRLELGRRIRAIGGGRGGDSDRRRGPGPGPGAFRDGPRGMPGGPAVGPPPTRPAGSRRVL